MSKKLTRAYMRKIIPEQVQMGEIDITQINIELDSRDEIPQLLRGFSIYTKVSRYVTKYSNCYGRSCLRISM